MGKDKEVSESDTVVGWMSIYLGDMFSTSGKMETSSVQRGGGGGEEE